MRLLRPLLIVGGALGLTALPQPVEACSISSNVLSGGHIVGATTTSAYPLIPVNASFLWSQWNVGEPPPDGPFTVAIDTVTQSPIQGSLARRIYNPAETSIWRLSATFLTRPDEMLEPGLTVSPVGQMFPPIYTTGNYIDSKPPSATNVTCAWLLHRRAVASCDATTEVRFKLAAPANDDHTPPSLMAYAIYLEKSAAEASTRDMPFVLVASSSPEDPTSLFAFVAHDWMNSPAYIAVSAIDFAGNESMRSNAVRVDAADAGPGQDRGDDAPDACSNQDGGDAPDGSDRNSGCACQMQRKHDAGSAALLPALAMLAWFARRARRLRPAARQLS